jgi:hypothetical protein
MSKITKLIDGSQIEWVDKETLRYSENGYSVLIWVDFEAGLFKSGRVIKLSSLSNWQTRPKDKSDIIDELKKNEIVEKIKHYYKSMGKKCRVE